MGRWKVARGGASASRAKPLEPTRKMNWSPGKGDGNGLVHRFPSPFQGFFPSLSTFPGVTLAKRSLHPWRAPCKGVVVPVGARPTPKGVVPSGSSRSRSGGNERSRAFDVKGRLSRSASWRAVTRVNAEQAPKTELVGADPPPGRGRPCRTDLRQQRSVRSHRGNGDGTRQGERLRNTGSPSR